MTHFETIDPSLLATTTGGKAPASTPAKDRTWGQFAQEYGTACVRGARDALQGSRGKGNLRDTATKAAIGCAVGVGVKAIDDLARR